MAVIEERSYQEVKADGSMKRVARFKATVTVKGFPRTSRTFERKTDAKNWSEKTEYEYRHQLSFGSTAHRTKSLKDAMVRYEDALKLSSPKRHEDIVYILHLWAKRIGGVRVGEITKDLIMQERDRLMTQHVKGNAAKKKIANASVNRIMGILNRVLNVMVEEWGWLPRNPMDGIKALPEPKGRTRFLQGDEQHKLLEAAKASENPDLYAIVVLAITTGARRGEIEKIRMQDVDFGTSRILLPVTKNGRARTLFLVGHAYDMVRQVHLRAQPDQRYLFASPHDKTKPNDFRTAWRKIVKRAGIEDFKFHDLRHTAASFYAQNGAGLHQIAEILGHSSYHVTKRYTHLLETDTANVVRTTAERVFGHGSIELAGAG